MMVDIILVAIDLSAASKQVFQQALSLAKATKASLILLHVLSSEELDFPIISPYLAKPRKGSSSLPPHTLGDDHQIYQQEWELFKNKGLELLRNLAKVAIAHGVDIEYSQIIGHSSSTICDFAQSCQADINSYW